MEDAELLNKVILKGGLAVKFDLEKSTHQPVDDHIYLGYTETDEGVKHYFHNLASAGPVLDMPEFDEILNHKPVSLFKLTDTAHSVRARVYHAVILLDKILSNYESIIKFYIYVKCKYVLKDLYPTASNTVIDILHNVINERFLEHGKILNREKESQVRDTVISIEALNIKSPESRIKQMEIYKYYIRQINSILPSLDKELDTLVNKVYKYQDMKGQIQDAVKSKVSLVELENDTGYTIYKSTPHNPNGDYLEIKCFKVGKSIHLLNITINEIEIDPSADISE